MKNEIRNRGLWLASLMLGGRGRKQPVPGDTPLFDGERKRNTGPMPRPELSEKEILNGK